VLPGQERSFVKLEKNFLIKIVATVDSLIVSCFCLLNIKLIQVKNRNLLDNHAFLMSLPSSWWLLVHCKNDYFCHFEMLPLTAGQRLLILGGEDKISIH